MAALTDPCGNPIPLPPLPIDFTYSLPSLLDLIAMLLALLGIDLPPIDMTVPCPKLLEAAAAAGSAAT